MSDGGRAKSSIVEYSKVDYSNTQDSKIPFKEIIDDLNAVAGTNYKNVEEWKKLIRARWNEGNRLEDFKTVHRNKFKDAKDPNHRFEMRFVRPETLYLDKFDGYLNQRDESNQETEASEGYHNGRPY